MQAGLEKAMTMLLPALAGANLIYGLGMLEMGLTLSFSQMVIDDEVASLVRKVLRGIPVSDETIAADLIQSVGARGNFLAEDHTIKYLRGYHSQPNLIDRDTRETWEAKGAKDLPTVATEKACELIKNHKVAPISDAAASFIRGTIEDYEDSHQIVRQNVDF